MNSKWLLATAIAATVLVAWAGLALMAPRMAGGAVLLVWGVFVYLHRRKPKLRSTRGLLWVVGLFMAASGALLVLFSSDRGALGDSVAVLYLYVHEDNNSEPCAGAEVRLHRAGSLVGSGETDPRGVWITEVVVPYIWRHRLIGGEGALDLDELQMELVVDDQLYRVELSGAQTCSVRTVMLGPSLIYVPVAIDRHQRLHWSPPLH